MMHARLAHLQSLIGEFDRALAALENAGLKTHADHSSLSAVRIELEVLGCFPARSNIVRRLWNRFLDLFQERTTDHLFAVARRCERTLLRAYEQACENNPPVRLANLLLHHYAVIKTASHRARLVELAAVGPSEAQPVLAASSASANPLDLAAGLGA